jgi:hypothetical protein
LGGASRRAPRWSSSPPWASPGPSTPPGSVAWDQKPLVEAGSSHPFPSDERHVRSAWPCQAAMFAPDVKEQALFLMRQGEAWEAKREVWAQQMTPARCLQWFSPQRSAASGPQTLSRPLPSPHPALSQRQRGNKVRPHERASFGHENVVYQCRTGAVGSPSGLHGMGVARRCWCDASVLP